MTFFLVKFWLKSCFHILFCNNCNKLWTFICNTTTLFSLMQTLFYKHKKFQIKIHSISSAQTLPTLIFLSVLGAFVYIILAPPISQSLSSSPCSSRKGQRMDGISLSIRAAAPISCMPNETRKPPWKFSSSVSYAFTWQDRQRKDAAKGQSLSYIYLWCNSDS